MSGLAGLAIGAGIKAVAGKALANARRDFAAIPPKVKLALLALALLAAAAFLHQHIAAKRLSAADKAGYDRARREDAAELAQVRRQALEARAEAEAAAAEISRTTKEKNDEEARRIADRARDVLVRGPGEARCRPLDHSGVPAGGGGHDAAGGQPDASRPAVPADELAAVPWPWLVDRAEQADLNRSEVLSWREWYDRQFKAWEQMRSSAPK